MRVPFFGKPMPPCLPDGLAFTCETRSGAAGLVRCSGLLGSSLASADRLDSGSAGLLAKRTTDRCEIVAVLAFDGISDGSHLGNNGVASHSFPLVWSSSGVQMIGSGRELGVRDRVMVPRLAGPLSGRRGLACGRRLQRPVGRPCGRSATRSRRSFEVQLDGTTRARHRGSSQGRWDLRWLRLGEGATVLGSADAFGELLRRCARARVRLDASSDARGVRCG